MSRLLRLASVLALAALLTLPILHALGMVTEDSAAGAIQLGTVGWFLTASFWIKSDARSKRTTR